MSTGLAALSLNIPCVFCLYRLVSAGLGSDLFKKAVGNGWGGFVALDIVVYMAEPALRSGEPRIVIAFVQQVERVGNPHHPQQR